MFDSRNFYNKNSKNRKVKSLLVITPISIKINKFWSITLSGMRFLNIFNLINIIY